MIQITRLALLAAATLALGVSGCSKNEPPAPPAEPAQKQAAAQPEKKAEEAPEAGEAKAEGGDSDAAKQAQQIWTSRCVACHGASGKGDGAAAAALNPKPTNYQDSEWQENTSDEEIEKVILKGGVAAGLSPLMPGNPDLEGKPEVVAELRNIVRSFAK